MHSLKQLLTLVALASLVLIPSSALAQEGEQYATSDTLLSPQGWIDFGQSISDAILTGNEGQKYAALRHVVRYGQYLDFETDVVFEVMRMYRDGVKIGPRQLAVVALGNMHSRWAIEFLDLSSEYEQSEELLTTIRSVVANYRKSNM
jgi:hypothetical protein